MNIPAAHHFEHIVDYYYMLYNRAAEWGVPVREIAQSYARYFHLSRATRAD